MKNKGVYSLLFIFAIILCIGIVFYGFPGTGFGQNPGDDWYAFRMFADHTGWAISSRGIVRTADNGAHWTIVTPDALKQRENFMGIGSTFFDAQHAWLVVEPDTQYIRYGDKQKPEQAHVFHTVDGGKTWKISDIPDTANTYTDAMSGPGFVAGSFAPLQPTGENRRMIDISPLVSTDGNEVWVGVSAYNVHTGGGQEIYTMLYQRVWHSTDGGQNWQKLWEDKDRTFPNDEAKSLSFASAKIGLMTGKGPLDILHTHDSQTWQHAQLPSQNFTPAQLPLLRQNGTFLFTSEEGIISLSEDREDGGYQLTFYITHDGGLHWYILPGQIEMPHNMPLNVSSASMIDDKHWLLTGNGVVVRTDDAGKHWQIINIAQQAQSIYTITFTSLQEGWAIGDDIPATGSSARTSHAYLLHTIDGGKSWQKVSYQINS